MTPDTIHSEIRPNYYLRIEPRYREKGIDSLAGCEAALREAISLFEHTSGMDPLYAKRRQQVEMLRNYLAFVKSNLPPQPVVEKSWKDHILTTPQKIGATIGLGLLLMCMWMFIDGAMSFFMH